MRVHVSSAEIMERIFGQIVQRVKPTMSHEINGGSWQRPSMSADNQELLFNNAYCARVKSLREERGWTAEQMATALGIPADRYRKYEYRSPLPCYLVERFALIVGRDVSYVITGKSEARLAPLPAMRRMHA